MEKRILSVLLALCLLSAFIPCAFASAEEEDGARLLAVLSSGECGDGSEIYWILDQDGSLSFDGTGRIGQTVPLTSTDSRAEQMTLGNVDVSFADSGSSAWTADSIYGGLKSNNKTDGSSSTLQITFTSASDFRLTFDTHVSSEARDVLTLSIDGNLAFSGGGTNGGRYDGLMTAGSHSVVLTYGKDGSGSSGDDGGFIYNIRAIGIAPWYGLENEVQRVEFPAGIENVPSGAFRDCSSLTEVRLSESIAEIGTLAFSGCTGLTEMYLPVGVTSIADDAFADCGEDFTLLVPAGSYARTYALRRSIPFRTVGDERPVSAASGECGGEGSEIYWILDREGTLRFDGTGRIGQDIPLTSQDSRAQRMSLLGVDVSFADSGSSAWTADSVYGGLKSDNKTDGSFSTLQITFTSPGMYRLTFDTHVSSETRDVLSLSIDGNTAFSSGGTNGGRYDSLMTAGSHRVELTYRKDGSGSGGDDGGFVYNIQAVALMPWYALENQILRAEFPAGIENVPTGAFRDCSSLTEVSLPESVTEIGAYAFSGCTSLTDVQIPESVTTLGDRAFENCIALAELTLSAGITTIGENAFAGYGEDFLLKVPAGSYARSYALRNRLPYETEPTAVALNESELTLTVGDIVLLTASLTPVDVMSRELTWLSTDSDVAEVSEGSVLAVAPGTAVILVRTVNNLTASCTVTVIPPKAAEGVTLDREELVLDPGSSEYLTAAVTPPDAREKGVLWSSEDENVASVDENGWVTLLTEGSTVITATTVDGGYTASCAVRSPIAVSGVTLNKSALALAVGQSETLIPRPLPENADNVPVVAWNSTRPSVVTVSADGVVAAVSPGAASIVAIMDTYTAVCYVTVAESVISVTGVSLNTDRISDMEIGSSRMLSAAVEPADAANRSLRYTTSDPAVATVSTGGVVTAVGPGSAVITVTTDDGGFTDSCTVTVAARRAIASVGAELPESAEVTVAGSPPNLAGLIVTATYTDGSSATLTEYTVSVPEITEPGTYTAVVTVADPEDPDRTHTAEFPITTVARTLQSLTLAQLPTKRSYLQGEALDPSGLRVTAEYNDGTVTELSDTEYSLTGYSADILGSQTVTVAGGEKTAEFTVTVHQAASDGMPEAPRVSIGSVPGGKRVELTGAEGAEIRYTLDGSEPDSDSDLYEGPITLTETTSVRAAVYLEGAVSAAVSARVSVQEAAAPEASHESGLQLPSGTVVTLRSETAGAAIYYTTDGTEPTVDSLRFGSSILVTGDVTIRAVAVKDGCRNSEVTELSYTVPASVTKDAVISLGAVSGRAGDLLSLPAYIFAEDAVTEFRFTLRYDPALFEYRSVTPGEGAEASAVFVAADPANGTVTVMYSGAALGTSELFTLNLLALESDEDGTYPLTVSEDANLTVRTEGNAALMVSVSPGEISLQGSRDGGGLSGTVNFASGGEAVTAAEEMRDREEFTANVELEAAPEQAGIMVNVYLAIYNRRGAMASLDTWEVEISNLGVAFMQTIRIPRNVDVGAVKLIILSDGNLPMMTAGIL